MPHLAEGGIRLSLTVNYSKAMVTRDLALLSLCSGSKQDFRKFGAQGTIRCLQTESFLKPGDLHLNNYFTETNKTLVRNKAYEELYSIHHLPGLIYSRR